MAGGITINVGIKGAEELRKSLLQLDRKVAKQIMRAAMRDATKIVADEAKRLAPDKWENTGTLRENIKVRAAVKMRRGQVGFVVTSGSAGLDNYGDAFYGYFLEYGFNKLQSFKNKYGAWKTMKPGSRADAYAKRYAAKRRQKAREYRRLNPGYGLQPKGTSFRERQERFFLSEGYKAAARAGVRSGQVPTKRVKRPYLRPAFDSRVDIAVDLIATKIRNGITAATR